MQWSCSQDQCTGEGGEPVDKPKPVIEIGIEKKMPKKEKKKFSESLSRGNNGYLIFKISLLQILVCKIGTISNFF